MNTNEQKIQDLKAEILVQRKLQYIASQMRNARKVGDTVRKLNRLYKELDALTGR